MTQEKVRVAPEVCSFVNEDNTKITLEISIPGVKKENIHLKMNEDSFTLSSPRDDIEYVTTMAFCCPVDPKRAEAKYENGLLRIKVPFQDEMAKALTIKVG